MSSIYYSAGWNALFSMFVTLGLIVVVWVLLREIRWDKIFLHPLSPGARLLQLLLAIVIGHQLARFVLDYWNWTASLKWLFGSE
ncbi:DUF1146 family protein [Cohnella thermotolerans]|jgi:uncharacterized integral membrane protein (TIGR02327 family)|uniref:DUF1146 family protein n=1 Tax=Cohnella thermotolerans TaxID=329858 RepID=UPI0004106531|nr:DUF1146 domain-containing protein [Cohnella thermotolerans]